MRISGFGYIKAVLLEITDLWLVQCWPTNRASK